jgi:hypothetical protein
MQKLCLIFTISLVMMFFYTDASAKLLKLTAAAMSSDDFQSAVQTQSQQTQTRINQQLQQILSNKAPASSGAPPSSSSVSQGSGTSSSTGSVDSGSAPYTGFGPAPSSSAPASSGSSGSNLNIKY